MDLLFGLGFLLAGAFSAICAAANFTWFMEHPKAKLLSLVLTRTGARAFYVLLGIGLIVVGALMMLGVISAPE